MSELIDEIVVDAGVVGSVTNGVVNAAIEAAPATTRAALELGSAALEAANAFDPAGSAAAAEAAAIAASVSPDLTVRNVTGSTIPFGAAVKVAGSSGQTTTIELATNVSKAGVENYLGLVTESGGIANNATGTVQVLELVENLDTAVATEGDIAYVGVDGSLIYGTEPSGTVHIQKIGIVTNAHPTLGAIKLRGDYLGTEIGNLVKNAETEAEAQTAIGVDTLKTSQTILAPNAAAKLRGMSVLQTPSQLTVLGLGDSLGYRIVTGMTQKLESSPGVIGYALDSLFNSVVSGTVVVPGDNSTANFQPTIYDSGRVWNMSSGSVIQIGILSGTLRTIASDSCTIWASKQSGGGTLTLEYSNDKGATWISSGLTGSNTVSTAGTAGEVARISVKNAGAVRSRFWRITASGGPVNYVGAKIHDSTASGIVIATSFNGGLRIDQSIQGSSSIRNQIGTDLGQSLGVIHYFEDDGQADQSEVSTYLSNWTTALPSSDFLIMGQTTNSVDVDGSVSEAMKILWDTAIESNPMAVYLETKALIPAAYMEEAMWNDPDDLHKDDAVWQAIAANIWTKALGGAPPVLTGNPRMSNGSDLFYRFGSGSEVTDRRHWFHFPVSSAGRGGVGMESTDPATGLRSVVEAIWQNSSHAKIPNGMAFQSIGSTNGLLTISQEGAIWAGAYDATFPNAYTESSPARMFLREGGNTKGVLNLNHTGGAATWVQRWQQAGTTRAEMRPDGELNLKTITTGAVYADDAAAATGGIPVGGFYRKTDGTVVWRQS